MTALTDGVTRVRGCDVRWWARGGGDPALVLVHGGSANSAWWEPMWPYLDEGQQIVAMDLSGHGDSGHRDGYPLTTWAEEMLAVIRDAAGGRAVIVGHSMGGRIAALAAALEPAAVRALVLVDSAVPLPDGYRVPRLLRKIYPTVEAAIAAFRLMPPQDTPDADMLERVGRRSIAPLDDGWSWKFDPRVIDRLPERTPEHHLPQVRCPAVCIHGERSEVTKPWMASALAAAIGRDVPLLTVPGAYHHVSLDRPRELAAILRWLPETLRTPTASPGPRR